MKPPHSIGRAIKAFLANLKRVYGTGRRSARHARNPLQLQCEALAERAPRRQQLSGPQRLA